MDIKKIIIQQSKSHYLEHTAKHMAYMVYACIIKIQVGGRNVLSVLVMSWKHQKKVL